MAERRFPAAMETLREALSWILANGKEAGLPNDRLFHVELACEEALTNVIRYAYPDGGRDVVVWAGASDRGFEVRIVDDGISFNPLERALPDTGLPLDVRNPGGLGILMVRDMTDEVTYSRDGNRNCLTLTWYSEEHGGISK